MSFIVDLWIIRSGWVPTKWPTWALKGPGFHLGIPIISSCSSSKASHDHIRPPRFRGVEPPEIAEKNDGNHHGRYLSIFCLPIETTEKGSFQNEWELYIEPFEKYENTPETWFPSQILITLGSCCWPLGLWTHRTYVGRWPRPTNVRHYFPVY